MKSVKSFLTKLASHSVEGLITAVSVFLAMGSFFWFDNIWAKLSGFAVSLIAGQISIRNRLNDFMQAHGAELAAALAPELMNYSGQHSAVQRCAMQHSLDYLREALQVWLAAGEKINYSVQDNDILTAIGFRPDTASRDGSREKFTPAQNLNYTRRRAELAVQ
jgi:hypothetical protein